MPGIAISARTSLSPRSAAFNSHASGIAARVAMWLWACLGAAMAWAGPAACVLPSTLPATELERRIALHELDLQRTQCSRNADWHAQRGFLLLGLGRAAEAAEYLERAILLAPDHAGARVDYADALAALGDLDSARALAEALLALPDIPPAARQHLLGRIERWQTLAPTAPAWQFARELGAGLAWESNLNGGPADSSLWLTLPEGLLNVEVLPGERPQSGFVATYDLGATALRPLDGDRQLVLRAQARGRDAPGARNDYLLGQFDATLVRSTPASQQLLQISHNEQGFGGERLLAETRLLAQRQWQRAPCAPALGSDATLRRFAASPVLDGRQLALRLGAQCSRGAWQSDAQLRLALDHPLDDARPGGRQQWRELRLGGTWQGARYGARVDLGLGHVADRDGYSPLLDAGQARTVLRHSARAELSRALDRHWELAVSMDWFRQRSSLAIFEVDNVGLYFGARYRH